MKIIMKFIYPIFAAFTLIPIPLALVALAIGASTAKAAPGDLFEADADAWLAGTGTINKFTPDGTRSTFASGLNPTGLAFDSAGNLFEADAWLAGTGHDL